MLPKSSRHASVIATAPVCAAVRHELHAASAAVFDSGVTLLAADGARPDPSVAARAITAGIVVAPHLANDRLESAAPVHNMAMILADSATFSLY